MTTIDVNTGPISAPGRSKRPCSGPTSRRPRPRRANYACVTSAGSSSSTSST
jgi:hypothetical protein